MGSLYLSPDRLVDPHTIGLFKDVFAYHCGFSHIALERDPLTISEYERLQVVPLVFGLLPQSALFRARKDTLVKPLIRDYLISLGVAGDEDLISVLKAIADQYWATLPQSIVSHGGGLQRRRYGIADVRSTRHYHLLLERQSGRCATCGVVFDGQTAETLDHVVPWRLVGDVMTGSNWRILCAECNSGKREWVSSLQSAYALNWFYSADDLLTRDVPPVEARYVALARAGHCEVSGCTRGPAKARLYAVKRIPSGLLVGDNLAVLCDIHV